MFKKIIATVALVFVLPLLANAASYTMTASVTSGTGTASPASLTRVSGLQNPAPFFDFAPGTGFHVETISGLPALPATYTLKNKISGATVTLPAATGVIVRVAITNLTAPVTLGGVFTNTLPVANAGIGQVVFPGTVTLSGLASVGATSYTWTQTAGPAVILTPGVLGTVTFNGVTLASYTFRLTINGGSTATTFVTVTNSAAAVARTSCNDCHKKAGVGQNPNIYSQWSSSVHKVNLAMCFNCHVGTNTGGHPGSPVTIQCATCHGDFGIVPSDYVSSCAACHVGTTVHGAQVATAPAPGGNRTSCIDCHAAALQHPGTFVKDNNNGVRAITAEFDKWSHHVTGVTLNDAHCAACHLEGKVVNGAIVVDTTVHMSDAKTHLRDTTANTDADFAWDPSAPDHSGMDKFCMSCHDANGAVSLGSVAIQALINATGPYNTGKTASASNPFGDTISNRYDKMLRPAVVNVSGQFDTTNNSHHAVKGPRYTGRTRNLAGPRTIASPATFSANSSATLFGARSTMYDAGNLNQLYTPLENTGGETAPRTGALALGDDSTLHCGDCHTVGQWKVGSSQTANGTPTPDAIGAHGSQNEYLLRNSIGTDERHTQNAFVIGTGANANVVSYANPSDPFLVCYNCHNYTKYGSIFVATGVFGGHVGEYDATGRCNGVGNTIPFNGYTTGKATDGTQFKTRFGGSGLPIDPATGKTWTMPTTLSPLKPTPLQYTTPAGYNGEQIADFGNVFGIQCANCHNSGAGNAYGGIHGSLNNQTLAGFTNAPVAPSTAGNITVSNGTYIDGAQNTTKIIRFLPGLGDASHVPGTLGGVTNGTQAVFKKYSAYGFAYYSSNRQTGTKLVYVGKNPSNYFDLPVRSDLNKAIGNVGTGKLGSIPFLTGGVTNDTNWEQKHWQQTLNTYVTVSAGVPTYNNAAAVGAGCYTLGNAAENSVGWPEAQQGKPDQNGNTIPVRPATNEDLRGPSQGVAGQPNPLLFDNWGGCDDHGAPVGGGNHGFIKRIVRPVTY